MPIDPADAAPLQNGLKTVSITADRLSVVQPVASIPNSDVHAEHVLYMRKKPAVDDAKKKMPQNLWYMVFVPFFFTVDNLKLARMLETGVCKPDYDRMLIKMTEYVDPFTEQIVDTLYRVKLGTPADRLLRNFLPERYREGYTRIIRKHNKAKGVGECQTIPAERLADDCKALERLGEQHDRFFKERL